MKYEVMVAGTVDATYTDKEKAEQRLEELRHSFLAMVHPKDTFFIREKK